MKNFILYLILGWAVTISYGQNNALDFDGTNDFVQIADHIDFNGLNQLTLEAWIYPKAITNPGTNIIINKENEWEMGIRNGMLAVATRNTVPGWNWVSSGTAIAADQWTHVAVTYDGANYVFYVNGVMVNSSVASGQIDAANTYSNDVLIGKRLILGGDYFTGTIDEVAIWNTPRSSAEVAADMQGNIPCGTAGLIGYYTFDQGVAYADNTGIANIMDCSGNHNGIPVMLALNGCASNFQPGYVPNSGGLQIVGNNVTLCAAAPMNYTVLGFHTGVTWSVTGGIIMSSTGCSATVQWNAGAPSYNLTINEAGVGTVSLDLQEEGDINMACNDLVNLSVDSICQAVVTPAMVLEGEQFPDASYEVIVTNQNGVVLPGNLVTKAQVGQILNFTVKHKCSGNSCWGQIKVEDKWIPQLVCSDTAIVTSCDMGTEPEDVGFPLPAGATYTKYADGKYKVDGFDPCDTIDLSFRDDYTKFGCATDYYALIVRHWKATDKYGNMSQCVDTIKVTRGDVSAINFPINWDGRPGHNRHLECDAAGDVTHPFGWNPLPNGNPSPFPKGGLIGTGYPTGVSCDHIAVTYRDSKLPICGNAYKLLRVWKVFDWCTGTLRDTLQIIKVVDNKAPTLSCPGRHGVPADTIGTDYYNCTASFLAPIPIANSNPPANDTKNVYVLAECSDWTYKVYHKAAISPEDCTPDNLPGTEVPRVGTDPATGLPIYRVTGMPQGCNWLYYIFTDACGNKDTCQFDIYVKDTRTPVAICDHHTIVGLNASGEAKLYAESVDDGSYDNCMLDRMVVRRMTDNCNIPGNTQFGPFVQFCCEDVANNPIMVVFRVYDKLGNFSECMVEVNVQDKIAPTLACPADKHIQCGQDYTDLNLTGRATVTDVCGGASITHRIVAADTTVCGIGYVVRRWVAEDAGGLKDSCDQYIYIDNSNPFSAKDIAWPSPKTVSVNGCSVADAAPDLLATTPKRPQAKSNDACANIVVGYKDQVFHNTPEKDVCIKIIRTWTVIDWCQFDRDHPNSGKGQWTYTQTILIKNSKAPIIDAASCKDLKLTADANCALELNLTGAATDDCTPANELIWSYEIDLGRDGSVDINGIGQISNDTVPAGHHRFTWKVEDQCGNIGRCSFNIDVLDEKDPTPYCRSGVVTTLMNNSKAIQIWASDFNIGSFDNCTPDSLLKFSFSKDVNDKFRTYTCDSLANGIADTFDVEMWVTDLFGNQAFCAVKVIIQDNMDICPDNPGLLALASGKVMNEKEEGVDQVQMTLLMNNDYLTGMKTKSDGVFSFDGLEKGRNYALQPSRSDDPLNGVNTRDLVVIQKYLLGKIDFTSPYDYFAADANGSKTVSTADILLLRKLILGKLDHMPNNKSWRFFPRQYSFQDPKNPLAEKAPEIIELNGMDQSYTDLDFMAIKVGDLTHDAKANIHSGSSTRSEKALTLNISDKQLLSGEETTIELFSSDFKEMEAMQFTLYFDPDKVEVLDLQSDVLKINGQNMGRNHLQNGLMTFAWNDASPHTLREDQAVLKLKIKARSLSRISDVLKITSSITPALAFDKNGAEYSVEMRFFEKDQKVSEDQVFLFQNYPNPFDASTVIAFRLPKEGDATLTVRSIAGKTLMIKRISGVKGLNKVVISKSELSSGVLYYQLESCGQTLTRKMILL